MSIEIENKAPTQSVYLATLLLLFLSVSAFGQSPETAEKVTILPRSTWATSPRIESKFSEHSAPINQIVLHHSGAAIHLDGEAEARINNSIRSWHMEVKGKWGDVAYHYILDTEGNIYEGRPESAVGRSFTKYDLDRKLLICVLGDYRPLEEKLADLKIALGRDLTEIELKKVKREDKEFGNELTEETKAALVELISAKAKEFGLDGDAITTHRKIADSSCPGANFQGWFDSAGLDAIEANLEE